MYRNDTEGITGSLASRSDEWEACRATPPALSQIAQSRGAGVARPESIVELLSLTITKSTVDRVLALSRAKAVLPLEHVAQRLAAHSGQRQRAAAQRARLVGVAAVEQARRGLHRLAERLVVRMPPEVARARGLPGHQLHVHALVEAELRVRAPQARALNAAPGARAGPVAEHVVVHPDHPGLEPPGDALPLGAVHRPDRGAEAELGVVRERDRLVLVLHGHDRDHRTEDLLAHDAHLVRHAAEDRGPEEGRLGTPAVKGRAIRHGVVDELLHRLELLRRHHRPDLGLPLHRVPNPQASGALDHALDEAPGHVLHHVHALDAGAGLPGIGETAPEAAGDRVREIGVGADDHRVLAAQLQHGALHPLRALDADTAADLDRAREEDLRRAGLDQRLADGPSAVHRAHKALGHARALEDLLDLLAD